MVRKSSFFPKLDPRIVPRNSNHSGTKPKKLIKIYIDKISFPSSNFKIAHFTLYFYKGIVLKIRGQNGLFSAFTIDMVRKSSFFRGINLLSTLIKDYNEVTKWKKKSYCLWE